MQSKKKKIKIVHFIHKPFLAGAQRASLDILKAINSADSELYLIYAEALARTGNLSSSNNWLVS